MEYRLAQLNIARFRLPAEDPVNEDFVNSLDQVNAAAEAAPGFIWRLIGDGNDAMDVQAFDDPNMIVNLSVWSDVRSLANYVYRNPLHKQIMSRRKEWFDKTEFHMVLWWVEQDRLPTVTEAKIRLDLLRHNGPTYAAFTFKQSYAAPGGELVDPFREESS